MKRCLLSSGDLDIVSFQRKGETNMKLVYFVTKVMYFSPILGARTHLCSPGTLWEGLVGTGGCFLDDFGGWQGTPRR